MVNKMLLNHLFVNLNFLLQSAAHHKSTFIWSTHNNDYFAVVHHSISNKTQDRLIVKFYFIYLPP